MEISAKSTIKVSIEFEVEAVYPADFSENGAAVREALLDHIVKSMISARTVNTMFLAKNPAFVGRSSIIRPTVKKISISGKSNGVLTNRIISL